MNDSEKLKGIMDRIIALSGGKLDSPDFRWQSHLLS